MKPAPAPRRTWADAEIETIVLAALTHVSGLQPPAIRPDMTLADDLHIDSLDEVELAMRIEDCLAFTIEITPDQISSKITAAELTALVQRLARESAS